MWFFGKNLKKFLFSISIVLLLFCLLYLVMFSLIKDEYSFLEGESTLSESSFPISVEIMASENNVTNYNTENFYNSKNLYAKTKIFGIIPLKSVTVNIIPKMELTPAGNTIGVKMLTKGLMVVGVAPVVSGGKKTNPAADAGVQIKDIIVEINGGEINTIEDLTKVLAPNGLKPLILLVKRDEEFLKKTLTPVLDDATNEIKMGVWVRDSAAGIGTVTFIDEETGFFGGLGHGICDVDTGELMPLYKGVLQKSTIASVIKGQKGMPGELNGVFDNKSEIGTLLANGNSGIFGIITEDYKTKNHPIPIALKEEIKLGEAFIYSNVSGDDVQKFEVQIVKITGATGKNMGIKITDPRLVEKTGGIVQGMSGSPIVQNGKLIGAVTHVLIDDPTCGYAIFIENMLKDAKVINFEGKNRAFLPSP